jgi:hypothetical protein
MFPFTSLVCVAKPTLQRCVLCPDTIFQNLHPSTYRMQKSSECLPKSTHTVSTTLTSTYALNILQLRCGELTRTARIQSRHRDQQAE